MAIGLCLEIYKKRREKMKKSILSILLCLLLAGSVEAATIKRDCFVCQTPSDFDRINRYYRENDMRSAGQMVVSGICTPITAGSKATVLNSKSSKTKVRVQGIVGWTSSNNVN